VTIVCRVSTPCVQGQPPYERAEPRVVEQPIQVLWDDDTDRARSGLRFQVAPQRLPDQCLVAKADVDVQQRYRPDVLTGGALLELGADRECLLAPSRLSRGRTRVC